VLWPTTQEPPRILISRSYRLPSTTVDVLLMVIFSFFSFTLVVV